MKLFDAALFPAAHPPDRKHSRVPDQISAFSRLSPEFCPSLVTIEQETGEH
jgi:hypothetical protein